MADANNTVTPQNLTLPPNSIQVIDPVSGAFTLPYRLWLQNNANAIGNVTYGFNANLQAELAALARIQANAAAFQNAIVNISNLANGVISDVDNAVAGISGLTIALMLEQAASLGAINTINDVGYLNGIPVGSVVIEHQIQQNSVNEVYTENFLLLGGRLGDNEGWVLSNTLVYVDNTTTLTEAFTQQTSYTDGVFAQANNAIITLATEIGSVSEELTQLTANTSSEFANVTVQLDAVSTLSNASALSLTFLGVSDPTGSTFALNETTVFIGNTGNSLGQTLTGLQASIGDNTALIDTETTVRADQTSALANSITVTQTQVDGNTSTITELTSSVNGISAEAGVALDVNGFISGWRLLNNGASGSAIFLVNDFAVVTPGVAPFIPFEIIGGTVFMPHAVVGTLDANTVNTNNLNIGAVTTPTMGLNSVSNIYTASSSSTVVQNAYQTLIGGPMTITMAYGGTIIIGGFAYANDGGGHGSSSHTSRVGIIFNGGEINFNLVANNPWAVDQALYVQAQVSVGAGTYTVDLWGSATNNDFFTQRQIYAQTFYR